MKFVLLTHDYPPQLKGGVGRITQIKAEALARRGHDVHVVSRDDQGGHRCSLTNGVKVHRVRVSRRPMTAEAALLGVPQGVWDESAVMCEHVDTIARVSPIDFVDAPIWRSVGIACLLSGKFRVVTSLQTTESLLVRCGFAPEDEHSMGKFRSERRLLTDSHSVIANSAAIRRDLEALYNVDLSDQRTTMIHHGILDQARRDAARSETSAAQVLTVGRLEPRKGTKLLMATAVRILELTTGVEFHVVGADPHALVEQCSTTLRYSTAMRFHGQVSDEALAERYANADIVLFTSRYESFGLTLVEAMMHSIPVVACRSAAVEEVLGHGTGFIVEPDSVECLSLAVVSLLRDSELRTGLGRQGRARFMANFEADTMVSAYEGFLSDRIRAAC